MTRTRNQRLDALIGAWHAHIQQAASHTPSVSEDGNAMHDTNLAATYIRCTACDWDHSLEERYRP